MVTSTHLKIGNTHSTVKVSNHPHGDIARHNVRHLRQRGVYRSPEVSGTTVGVGDQIVDVASEVQVVFLVLVMIIVT